MRKLIVLLTILLSNISYAQDASVVGQPNVTMRQGDNFVASGVMVPKTLFDEFQAIQAALRNARLELNKEVKALNKDKEGVNLLKEDLLKTEKKLYDFANKLSTKVVTTQEDINKLKQEVMQVKADLAFKSIAVASHLDMIVTVLNELHDKLKKQAQKQWGFGLHALTNFDWSTEEDNWAQFNMLGVSSYFMNQNLLISLDVSAGINSLSKQLSWGLGASGEYRLNYNWSLGGSMFLAQDLGNLEGTDTLTWTVGPKLRYLNLDHECFKFSVSLSPQFGVQGKKEESYNSKPDWYPNFGTLLTFDYFVL